MSLYWPYYKLYYNYYYNNLNIEITITITITITSVFKLPITNTITIAITITITITITPCLIQLHMYTYTVIVHKYISTHVRVHMYQLLGFNSNYTVLYKCRLCVGIKCFTLVKTHSVTISFIIIKNSS